MFHALLCEMERYPSPLICAVRGYAVGVPSSSCCMQITSWQIPNARSGFQKSTMSCFPPVKGMRQAAQKLGQRASRQLLYSGDLIAATKALEIGAVDEIVETDKVADRALSVCRQLREKDRKLFTAIKHSLNLTGQMSDDELDAMTIADLKVYLAEESSADARARFLARARTST